ncbi:hypothetical protein CLU79DRAFT_891768 [Phycomyces nitens]|nr:hypothetical protein CLU79DRAFT_891768 [Phycomyces nitens]
MSTVENIRPKFAIKDSCPQNSVDKWQDLPFPTIHDSEFTSRWSLKDRQKFDESVRRRVIEYRKEPPTEKSMAHSYVEQYLPFKSSPEFNGSHSSADGSIQFGKILEAIDDVAGVVSGRHIECMKVNDIFVNLTVSVEQIYLNMPDSVEDYKLCGCVGYTKGPLLVGILTLETVKQDNILMDTRILHPRVVPELGTLNPNTVAIFEVTFMQLNTLVGKPCNVGQLKCATSSEKMLFERIEAKVLAQQTHKQIRQKLQVSKEDHGSNHKPKIESQNCNVSNTICLSDTHVESHEITSPQDRNAHGTTFGGYLINGGYKVGCMAATHFLGSSAFKPVNMNDILFILPIHTGEHIRISAKVIYSDPSNKGFVVRARIEILNVKTMKYKLAILMNMVFAPVDQIISSRTVEPDPNELDLWSQGQYIFNQKYNTNQTCLYSPAHLGQRPHKL